jgi:hypothetical protein
MRQQVMNYQKMDLMLKTKVFKPAADGRGVEVTVSETSDRLQLLVPPMGRKTLLVLNCLSKHLGT